MTLALTALLAAVGCATTSQNVKLHDEQTSKSLEDFVRAGFAAMDAGDMNYWKSSACPEAVMWDIDEKGMPFTAKGKDEIGKALDGFQQMMAAGTKIQSTIVSMECRSSSISGHCVVEFDQTFTKDGQTMGPLKFRGTAIGEWLGDKWIWSHWHASVREAAPAAVEAPVAAAPSADPAQ